MKNSVKFALCILIAIALICIYVGGSLLLIESQMPSHNVAPYAISWAKYDGAWLLPEWHILFDKGTITLDETGAVYEVSGYWKREGISWVHYPEATKFESHFRSPDDKLRMFFGAKRSDHQ